MIRAEAQYPPVAFFANFGGVKPPEIRRRLEETGRTQTALARHLGKSKDSVSRMLMGARAMTADEADRIREFFEGDQPREPAFVRIPVFGYAAAGGEDRVALASDQVLDHLEVPAGVARGETFGLRISGDSMYPRLFSGETVIVERNVAPVRGKEVAVELKDGTGLVKEYRGQKDGYVFLFQYNPEQEVRIELSKIRAMHFAWKWR